jgi:signal transduction histidine kinase
MTNSILSDVREGIRSIQNDLARLCEDTHDLSYRLHPSVLELLGLTEALRSECERISQTFPIQLDTDLEDLPDKLPPDVALCLFRITQEALRNVLRHANASQADVSLKRLDGGLELIVRDDGTGFDNAKLDGGNQASVTPACASEFACSEGE